ncbi:unnamed protein product, partial [Polarella glacialis]
MRAQEALADEDSRSSSQSSRSEPLRENISTWSQDRPDIRPTTETAPSASHSGNPPGAVDDFDHHSDEDYESSSFFRNASDSLGFAVWDDVPANPELAVSHAPGAVDDNSDVDYEASSFFGNTSDSLGFAVWDDVPANPELAVSQGVSDPDMLQRNVQQALAAGVRVEYHVACEEHLFFARRLPLPRSSLMVHPVNGRIARLMERGGLLLPLLVDLIAELQVPGGHGRRPWAESVQFSNEMQAKAADGQNLQQMGWDWSDSEERLLLARWCSDGRLSFARISGKALASLCKKVPSPGQWFCARCLCCNDAKVEVCAACQNASLPPLRKVGEAPSPDDVARLRETGVSALASSEDALEDGELPPYWLLQSTDGNQTWAWAEFGL